MTATRLRHGHLADFPRVRPTCVLRVFFFNISCLASLSSSDGLRALIGRKIGSTWAPRGGQNPPKWAFQIGPGSPFFGTDVGKPWKTDLGAIWRPSWGPLGPILGVSGVNLGPSRAILGVSGPNLEPSWGRLGPARGHPGLHCNCCCCRCCCCAHCLCLACVWFGHR